MNINFQRSDGSDDLTTLFFVNVGVIPRPVMEEHEWGEPAHPKADRYNYMYGVYGDRVQPPRAVSMDPHARFVDARWRFHPSDRESVVACGAALATMLVERTAPELERLLDREVLLDTLRSSERATPQLVRLLEVVFAVDDGGTEGIEELLAEQDNPRLTGWARERTAQQPTSDGST